MKQPANAATPAVAALVSPPVQVSVPGPPVAGVPAVIDSVTLLVSVVTTLPPASSADTLGWLVNAVPPVEVFGCWVKASFVAGPTATLNGLLSPALKTPGSVAWSLDRKSTRLNSSHANIS